MGAQQIVSESNKQFANLNIITVMQCLVHDRHVHGKIFTLWSACQLKLAAKSHLTAIFTACCYQLTTVAAWWNRSSRISKKSHPRSALTEDFKKTMKDKKYYVNTILDSKYSSAALSLRQHWPGNRLNGRLFSLPYSFIRGIYFVTGLTAGIQNPRRGRRIRNDLSGHGRPVLCVDRWSETSHFWNEGNHNWNGRRT